MNGDEMDCLGAHQHAWRNLQVCLFRDGRHAGDGYGSHPAVGRVVDFHEGCRPFRYAYTPGVPATFRGTPYRHHPRAQRLKDSHLYGVQIRVYARDASEVLDIGEDRLALGGDEARSRVSSP